MFYTRFTMKSVSLLFVTVVLSASLLLNNVNGSDIDCRELKSLRGIGWLLVKSSKTNPDLSVNFFLSTNKHREPVELSLHDWTALSNLELSKKTIIIIHGYKSGGRKSWVLLLKDRLLDFQDANVLLVDWNKGSHSTNYVNAAKNTEIVANRLLQFLQSAKGQIEISNRKSNQILWSHLHFIGHSLGAQISGQTANFLKEDSFWKVERITGLDPAKPCFKELGDMLKLDKEDADFVDIIHTQTDGLGLKENIGHMDFYVNGGVTQPECIGTSLTPKWNTMICSHRLAYKYFTESLANAINDTCKFVGYPWDGSSGDAIQILNSKIVDSPCSNCPEMGINAVKSNQRGKFLVIAAASEPHCQFSSDDIQDVAKVIRRIKD